MALRRIGLESSLTLSFWWRYLLPRWVLSQSGRVSARVHPFSLRSGILRSRYCGCQPATVSAAEILGMRMQSAQCKAFLRRSAWFRLPVLFCVRSRFFWACSPWRPSRIIKAKAIRLTTLLIAAISISVKKAGRIQRMEKAASDQVLLRKKRHLRNW